MESNTGYHRHRGKALQRPVASTGKQKIREKTKAERGNKSKRRGWRCSGAVVVVCGNMLLGAEILSGNTFPNWKQIHHAATRGRQYIRNLAMSLD